MKQGRGSAIVAGMRVDVTGHGPTVMLLHGLGSTRHIWDLTAPYMADRFRLVMPDLRGHGESPIKFDAGGPGAVIRDIESLRQVMNVERSPYVGHSWGAQLALLYAASYPERVSHLVMVDGGFLDFRLAGNEPLSEIRKQLEPPALDMTPEQYVDLERAEFGEAWRDSFAPIVLSTMHASDGHVESRLDRSAHLAVLDSMLDFEPRPALAAIQVPTLLVVPDRPGPGDLDWVELRDRSVQAAEEVVAQAQILRLPSAGHDVPLERPAELAHAIEEFLQQN